MEILTRLNWVDVLVVILMLRISYVAFQDGLSHEIFPLLASVITMVLSLHYYMKLGTAISANLFNMPHEITDLLSFLILVAVFGLISKLLKALLDKLVKVQWHPLLERFGGLVLGVARASIVTSMVLIILALAPLPYLQRSIRAKSLTGMHFLKIGPSIYERCAHILPTIRMEALSISKDVMVSNLVSDKSIAPRSDKETEKEE
jgi:uncharacterized membrane protein required for colicin V production